jgi:hypothetical protein
MGLFDEAFLAQEGIMFFSNCGHRFLGSSLPFDDELT